MTYTGRMGTRTLAPLLLLTTLAILLAACAGEGRTPLGAPSPPAIDQGATATAPPSASPTPLPSPTPTEASAIEEPATSAEASNSSPRATIRDDNAVNLQPLTTLTGHEDDVNQIAFSHDGTTLASASADGTVRLWDVSSGELIRTIEAHAPGVATVDFSADGSMLVSGGYDRTARLWRVEDGALLETIGSKYMGYALAVEFAPEGPLFAVADHLCDTQLRRAPNAILEQTLRQPNCTTTEGTVVNWGLDFSPDGRYVVTGEGTWCCGGSLQRWTIDRPFEPPTLLQGYNIRTRDLFYAPDGERVAVALLGSPVFWLVEAESGELLRTYDGHVYRVNSLAFSPDGELIASASRDRKLAIWAIDSSQPIASFVEHSDALNSVVFSPDGSWIATAASDDTVRLWGLP